MRFTPFQVLVVITLTSCTISSISPSQPVASSAPVASVANRLPTVISTGDGDTLRIDRQGEPVTIRIACIDAPEFDQPGGEEAAVRLRELLPVGQAVQVREIETDRYDRTVAELFLGNEPVGVRLVREGYAVVYDQYLENCGITRSLYLDAEAEARSAQRGFWSQANPIMPWDWRRESQNSNDDQTGSSQPNSPQSGSPHFGSPQSSSSPPTTTSPLACATTDCDCKDFRSQAEAQRFFESIPGDPHRLDGDGDGQVCEALP